MDFQEITVLRLLLYKLFGWISTVHQDLKMLTLFSMYQSLQFDRFGIFADILG